MDLSSPQLKDVLKQAREALKKQPRDAKLHSLIAPLYEQLGRYAEALPHLEFLVAATSPASEELYERYMKALMRTQAYAKATQLADRWQKDAPSSKFPLRYKALLSALMADYEASRQCYLKLYENDPSDLEARSMAGHMQMLVTDMQQGYDDYSVRQKNSDLASLLDLLPLWSGQPLAGKKIAVWAEQGIGDVVMFMGLLPWLLEKGGEAHLVVTNKLMPIISRSFPQVMLYSEDTVERLKSESFDYQLPVGNLIDLALPSRQPSAHPAYLKADSQRVEELRAFYADYAKEQGRKRLIGISWHTTNQLVGFARSISLPELDPLFSIEGIQFVSLQYGEHAEAIEECNRRFKDILLVDAGIDAFDDIDGLAAQMMAMDEVITIDNTTVHLAGALGVPTTLLLSTLPDWRWGLTRQDCRWYSSVRLERQESPLNWKPVIKRIRSRLMAS